MGPRSHTRRLVGRRTRRRRLWVVSLTKISLWEFYAGVAEYSVYITNDTCGFGVGQSLLKALIESSEGAVYWMLQSVVFSENKASIDLHGSAGFWAAGIRKRVGLMLCGPMKSLWREVVMVERRSQVFGVD